MTKMRTYSELIKLPTFEERFRYLMLDGNVGIATFGFERYLNQSFYKSEEWKSIRNFVIVRDNGCDLADPEREITGRIIVHHMNPITEMDIIDKNYSIMDPEFLITTTINTHNAIHFSDESILYLGPTIRTAGDTKLW